MLGKNSATILIILVILSAFLLSIFITDPKNYDHSRIRIFITIVAGLGIFITFFFYYNVVELQYDQQKMIFHERLEAMDDNILENFIQSLQDNYNKEPDFVKSLLPLQNPDFVQIEETGTVIQDNIEKKEKGSDTSNIVKYTLSFRIFSLWRDYINYHNYIIIVNDNRSYIVQFLQRCNSIELEQYWETMKIDYPKDTRALGDILFEYGKGIEKTPEAYNKRALELLCDKRYKKIIADSDNIVI